MRGDISRRDLLKGAALSGVGLALGAQVWADPAPEDKIRFACIGVGGKGQSDTADADRNGVVVAVCDVDEATLAKAVARYPTARPYTDFRKMLDEMDKSIDAVTVSTPDHTHAVAASMAMQMGKHCFCQKPLTHSLYEARRLGELARKHRLATQMGNQGTSTAGLRRTASMIRAGALGTVREVHVWTNRPIWDQGGPRAAVGTPPDAVHWDLWLGPAPERPFAAGYHPFAWRGWWDFGTGALGDMACHTMNLPFAALDLRNPTSVLAESSGHNGDSYPKSSRITYQFPRTDERPAVTLYWYDGGKLPPKELLEGRQMTDSGCLIVGEKGKCHIPGDYGDRGQMFAGAVDQNAPFTPSPGHFVEFARAIKTGEPARSNFPDYAGPLTETVLLGNLAVWAQGKKIEWDAARLTAKNAPEVEPIIRPAYRAGYEI